jgi:hypothetical protein
MRTIAFIVVLVQAVLFTPLFLLYGQVDPSRALAKEIALRAEAAGGLGVTIDSAFGDLEIDARRDIADQSTSQCLGRLVTSWSERLTE